MLKQNKKSAKKSLLEGKFPHELHELIEGTKQTGLSEISFDVGNMGTWEWNLESGTMKWPAQFKQLDGGPGFSLEKILNNLRVNVQQGSVDELITEIREILTGRRERLHVEMQLTRAENELLWIEAQGNAIFDDKRKLKKIIGVCIDITERKVHEQRQVFLANASRALSFSFSDAVALQNLGNLMVEQICDACAFDIRRANGYGNEIIAANAKISSESLAKTIKKIVSPEIQNKVLRGKSYLCPYVSDEDIKTWSDNEQEYRYFKELHIQSVISLPMIARKKVIGVMTLISSTSRSRFNSDDLSFVSDLADRAAIAVDNARLYEELRQSDQAKGDFLSVLSHELRNPLTPIKMSVDILKGADVSDKKYEEALFMIERQVGHMTSLLDDLLEVSRIKSGRISLRREIIDIKVPIKHAIDTFVSIFPSKKKNLKISIADQPILISADALRIEQIVVNLLNNAGKFTAPEGSIELIVTRHNNEIEIDVVDDGVGMSKDILSGIFKQHKDKLLENNERGLGGLGVGLQLVKSLAELHDGRVTAESGGLGKGSKFTVILPSLISMDNPETIKMSLDQSLTKNLSKHNVKNAVGNQEVGDLKILIVDDNKDVVQSLIMALTKLGYVADFAYDGREAVKKFASMGPNVVILDIGIPGMDGYEIAKRLKETKPKKKNFYLIALTGYSQSSDKEAIKKAGFDQHLIKPISLFALSSVLKNIKSDSVSSTASS